MVRYTESEVTDDPQFLEWVETVVLAVERTFKTDLAFVVKIDNWFGKRWLGFFRLNSGSCGLSQRETDAAALRPVSGGVSASVLGGRSCSRTPQAPSQVAAQRRESSAIH